MRSTSERRCAAIVSMSAAWLVACAGNGEGLDASGRPLGSDDPGSQPLTADFDSIQARVFTPICTTCHAGGAAPQGLRLDAGSSYDLLVGVPSTEEPSTLRVQPGDPDHSYLVQKLEGNAGVGARMPLGGPYLDGATIDVIRQWITDGALRSVTSVAAASKTFSVATTAPANGEVLAAAPATLVVAFTRELDRTRLAASTARLDRLDVDATTAPVSGLPLDVMVREANPSALLVQPRAALVPGRYALRVDTSNIADLAGNRLGTSATDAPLTISFTVGAAP